MTKPDNFGVKILRLLAELDRDEAEWRRYLIQKLAEAEERLILEQNKKGRRDPR